MIWTLEQIELIAGGLAPQGKWHKCEGCKIEYTSMGMAYACWKAHHRSYERAYSNIDTKAVKHQVSFDNNRPLCRPCTKRAEGTLQVVYMVDPPKCSRCAQQIQDPPKEELTPPSRSVYETHRDLLLTPCRESLVENERWRITQQLRKLEFQTGHEEMDSQNFKDFGPNRRNGKGAIPRSADGYSTIKKGTPLQCKSLDLGPGTTNS